MSNIITLGKNTKSVQYLCRKDKRLAKVISMVGNITYIPYEDGFAFLIHEIIEQMLSIKAGQKIYDRLEQLCNGVITPSAISVLRNNDIRNTGTSSSKVCYIKNIANIIIDGSLVLENLNNLSDLQVIKELTTLKGIGNWTAKMYLIFVLNRANILPFEDVAFLQSYQWLYKISEFSSVNVKKRCKKWEPYSSIASRYMYQALDLGLTKNEFHLFK
ncbi:DNA-3-methyladenine glycosylase family protein [Megasphaera sueciensis]|uniref:DNA-3-methyladenine glycosylase family protein n=1 Tax=Megasphaera sueciensis TaxID=349094 RepID=UPI003D006939